MADITDCVRNDTDAAKEETVMPFLLKELGAPFLHGMGAPMLLPTQVPYHMHLADCWMRESILPVKVINSFASMMGIGIHALSAASLFMYGPEGSGKVYAAALAITNIADYVRHRHQKGTEHTPMYQATRKHETS